MNNYEDIKKMALAFAQVEFYYALNNNRIDNEKGVPLHIAFYEYFANSYASALEYYSGTTFEPDAEE